MLYWLGVVAVMDTEKSDEKYEHKMHGTCGDDVTISSFYFVPAGAL